MVIAKRILEIMLHVFLRASYPNSSAKLFFFHRLLLNVSSWFPRCLPVCGLGVCFAGVPKQASGAILGYLVL